MRRILSIAMFFATIVLTIGCHKDETPSLKFNGEGVVEFKAEGGEQTFTFTAAHSWTIASTYEEWLSVTPLAGAAGGCEITLVAEGHEDGNERTTELLIKLSNGDAYRVNVTQKGLDRFDVRDIEEQYIVKAEGEDLSIVVDTNLDYELNIINEPKWIKVADDTRAMREDTITFNITENSSNISRIARIEVLNKAKGNKVEHEFIVIQSAAGQAHNEIVYNSDTIITLESTEGFGSTLAYHFHDGRYGRIIFDNEITAIPELSFANHADITSIQIPDGVTRIGHNAFFGCSELTMVDLSAAIESIETRAFSDCTALREITLPASVTTIGNALFEGCTLTTITANCDIPEQVELVAHPDHPDRDVKRAVSSTNDKHWLFGTTVESFIFAGQIEAYALLDFTAVKSVKFGAEVTRVNKDAFKGCTSLRKVEVESLEKWCNIYFGTGDANPIANNGAELIAGGQKVSSLTIPESIRDIKSYAFYNYSTLESINIHDNVRSIGAGCFAGCGELSSIYVGSGIKTIGLEVFNGCETPNLTINVNLPAFQKSILDPTHWLYGMEATNITYGNAVTAINDFALTNLASVEKVVIGSNVEYIGKGAFSGCENLRDVSFEGNAIKTLDEHAFYNCTALEYIELPASLETIGDYAFQNSALGTIVIPEAVTAIGEYAFDNCLALESIELKSTTPPSLGQRAIETNGKLQTIMVPVGSLDSYNTAAEWKNYSNYFSEK